MSNPTRTRFIQRNSFKQWTAVLILAGAFAACEGQLESPLETSEDELVAPPTVTPNPAVLGEDFTVSIRGVSTLRTFRLEVVDSTGARVGEATFSGTRRYTLTIPASNFSVAGTYRAALWRIRLSGAEVSAAFVDFEVTDGTSSVCGDATCDAGESCSTCASDCGVCPDVCGDSVCAVTESCASCSTDCGVCGDVCGDNVCGATETCSTCANDCGVCPVTTGTFLLEWDASTTRADGTPLTNLQGYRLYVDTQSPVDGQGGTSIDVGNVTQHSLTLNAGTYYVAAAAYDSQGLASIYSNQVTLSVP